MRVLLCGLDRAWRVTDLAETANASLGHVSNVRKVLLEREWIEKRGNGMVVVQPDAQLRTWRENYRQPAGHRISGYTLFHGEQLSKQLSGKLNPEPRHPRAVYSLNSAAQWFAPFARGGIHSFYADEPGARMLEEALKLSHVEKGANAIVRIPKDESLSRTPFSRRRASSAPVRSSRTLISGSVTIEIERPPTIWPRSASYGYDRTAIRRRLR